MFICQNLSFIRLILFSLWLKVIQGVQRKEESCRIAMFVHCTGRPAFLPWPACIPALPASLPCPPCSTTPLFLVFLPFLQYYSGLPLFLPCPSCIPTPPAVLPRPPCIPALAVFLNCPACISALPYQLSCPPGLAFCFPKFMFFQE